VSTGTTLRDNRLRALTDGVILKSQAALIGNRAALKERPEVLGAVRELLECIEAHLRAKGSYLLFANMRGESPESIAKAMLNQPHLGGLQGPTVSQVVSREDQSWFAVNIVVHKDLLMPAINELRRIGGSGVIVTPVTYIFEEEPPRYARLVQTLNKPA
jgi:ATP phosphoribosyltransferase